MCVRHQSRAGVRGETVERLMFQLQITRVLLRGNGHGFLFCDIVEFILKKICLFRLLLSYQHLSSNDLKKIFY